MSGLNVAAVESLGQWDDAFKFNVVVEDDDGDREAIPALVSRTTSVVAGFGDDGPTLEWVADRFRNHPRLIDNYEPLLPQLREWGTTGANGKWVVLTAEPA